MITFRAMRPEEFPAYQSYFIEDYAAEIAENFGRTLAESHDVATNELAEDLPQGTATPGHQLLCIVAGGSETIGYLWYQLRDHGKTAFILDIMLFEAVRGQGKGKAALLVLEEQLARTDVKEIKLRVAFKNDRARHLYEKVGFSITGYNMSKVLKAQDS